MGEKILIVDDESDIVEYMTDLLSDNGYVVDFALDGSQGYEKVQQMRPDLILLDLQMPNKTGVDMYRNMSMNKSIDKVPVIIVSGMVGSDMALNPKIPVIDKPINETKLLRTIKAILQ